MGIIELLEADNHTFYNCQFIERLALDLFPYLMTTFSLKATTPEHSAELSGMSQSGGYLIASVGPFLFGYGHTLFHSWTFVTACFLGLIIIMTIANLLLEREEKFIKNKV